MQFVCDDRVQMSSDLSAVEGTTLTDNERGRIERRVERVEDCLVIGEVLGLAGADLLREIDSLPDSDFDELAREARAATAAGAVC